MMQFWEMDDLAKKYYAKIISECLRKHDTVEEAIDDIVERMGTYLKTRMY